MLLWFRNDLRVHDNPALNYFVSHRQHKHAVFFVTKKQWQQHDWSAIKIDLILRHVALLKSQLQEHGIELKVIAVDDFSQQLDWLIEYCHQHYITQLVANSECEINEVRRDQALQKRGLELRLFEADVIVPKGKVLNQSGEMYKVYTPFKKAWLTYVRRYGFDYLGKLSSSTFKPPGSTLKPEPLLEGDNSSQKWPLVTDLERTQIPHFLEHKFTHYHELRDIPSIKGTSGLSAYLAIGALSPRYLLTLLLHRCPDLLIASDSTLFSWLNELIWREFYRHLLFHQPRLCCSQEFNKKYLGTVWPNKPAYFQAWCQGRTGYPLVDAAMTQLNQTGWMHNRLRMVVASFLTKQLLIDWRWGERYFMQHLIDGDLAANNGGWQWAASTGCDAQPYFRVFNPIRQSERFDPNGDFIRKYLSELVDVPTKQIHFPHAYLQQQNLDLYWPAIVDHKEARLLALAFYKV